MGNAAFVVVVVVAAEVSYILNFCLLLMLGKIVTRKSNEVTMVQLRQVVENSIFSLFVIGQNRVLDWLLNG